MFDFAWSEIGLIAAVALILIGPKDLPVAIRTITDMIKKARRMAGEFQTHVDEMLREANLGEVREHISAIRNFDVRGEIERHIDPDRSLRDTFSGNPLEPDKAATATAETAPGAVPADESAVAEPEQRAVTETALAEPLPQAQDPAVPAFIPPGLLPPAAPAADTADAPAFIPPQVVLQRSAHPSA